MSANTSVTTPNTVGTASTKRRNTYARTLALLDPRILQGHVARVRPQFISLQSPIEHRDVGRPPQGDHGQELRDAVLHFAVEPAALIHVQGPPGCVCELVDGLFIKEAAIGAAWRRLRRVTGEVVNVRILDANPRQRVELEVTALDVVVERRPFVTANVHRDAALGQLLLEDFGDTPAQL